ncbi:hypothetical protein YC2023_071739 [Brassica napus]
MQPACAQVSAKSILTGASKPKRVNSSLQYACLTLGWMMESRASISTTWTNQTDLDSPVHQNSSLSEFPLASPRSGIVHHLSSPDKHAHTRTLLRRSRSVGCAPVRDPANQLPCPLWVYSPVDSHTCQTPWSVFQDGSNGDPTGRRPEHADAEPRREARAADHD